MCLHDIVYVSVCAAWVGKCNSSSQEFMTCEIGNDVLAGTIVGGTVVITRLTTTTVTCAAAWKFPEIQCRFVWSAFFIAVFLSSHFDDSVFLVY